MNTLLYITPVIPGVTGNGLAMRAGYVLEALAASQRVTVLVAPLYKSFDREMPSALRTLCEDCVVVSQDAAAEAYRGRYFGTVHVFRLASMAAARSYLAGDGPPRRHLDLDDLDSKTRRRLAALCRENGDLDMAMREEAEGRRSELLEVAAFRRFDRVYVCSEADRQEIRSKCPAEIVVVPNAVRAPERVTAPPAEGPFRFLFLGTLGYYPNADAVVHLCERILPEIRRKAREAFEVDVAGFGASGQLREIAAGAGVRVVGAVPNVAPLYEAAHAVIAPIRAGGGTRIKILEAFSYRRPVVTTSIGLEGIDAQAGEHVLIGDSPEEFAAACLRLINDRALGERLAEAAAARWREVYSLEALRSVLNVSSGPDL